jgi:hypothetical protein
MARLRAEAERLGEESNRLHGVRSEGLNLVMNTFGEF